MQDLWKLKNSCFFGNDSELKSMIWWPHSISTNNAPAWIAHCISTWICYRALSNRNTKLLTSGSLFVFWLHEFNIPIHLINIWPMFNLGIDDLAVKPYIPHKSLLQWICWKMPCVITWAWSFLTSEVVEAVRGQTHHILMHTLALWHFPTAPVLLTKDTRNEISYDFQPPFSLHISNSRTKPAGLDF